MSDDTRSSGPRSKRPYGKKPFGKKKFGDRPGGFGGPKGGDRGSGPGKRFGEPRSRPWGEDRGSRPDRMRREGDAAQAPWQEGDAGHRPFKKKPFGDRAREAGFESKQRFGDRTREAGFESKQQFGNRTREAGFESKQQFGNRAGGGFKKSRPEGGDRFRGMYGRPDGERRENWRRKPGFGDRSESRGPSSRPVPRGESRPTPREESEAVRPHLADNELRYHGKNACLALLKSRPNAIVRVYVLREKADEYAPLIEFCAKNHLAYHLVGGEDLERLTDSIHHQGVCVIATAKRFFKEEIFFRELGAHRTLVIYLDGVANPHNLGAILRTAAHFGVRFVCVPAEEITKISPALYRTAEGGAETVDLVRVEDAEKFLDRLRGMGFQLYAFEPGEKTIPLFDTRLNEKSVFVFGAEVTGLSGIVKTIVETRVTIPGTGAVESLNVSVAAAVAMAEFERQAKGPRSVRIVKNKS